MIAKRLGAIALAVILIGGAWIIRDRVIDDDNGGSGDDDPPRVGREIVCVEDLRDACSALAEARDLDIRIEDASATLDALAALEDPADAPIWITMEPFPAMADDLRVTAGDAPLASELTMVGSSPIALVVLADRTSVLAAACGEPLDWTCVGEAAGSPWVELDGEESWREVRPAFAPIDTTLGLLGVADAIAGYFETSPIQLEDPDFVSWARRLARAVPDSALSGRSAIATIEVRRSALDIAVGAQAELSDASSSVVSLQYADPMIRADVVVAVPEGNSPPGGLTEELTLTLTAQGWDTATNEPNPLPSARELLAIREVWKGFS